MKKLFYIITALCFLFVLLPTQLSANYAPSSNAVIHIEGADFEYDLDVFYRFSRDEVFTIDFDDSNSERTNRISNYYKSEYPQTLNGFRTQEGYASAIFYEPYSSNELTRDGDTFDFFHFFKPNSMQIVIVTDEGNIIRTPVVEQKSYNAVFTIDLSDIDPSIDQQLLDDDLIEEDIPRGLMALDFGVRLIITLTVELLILALFMYKKKSTFLTVGITNLITQSTLTISVVFYYHLNYGGIGAFFTFIVAEFLIFLFEAIVYMISFKEHSRLTALLYALFANFVTMIIGLMLFNVFT